MRYIYFCISLFHSEPFVYTTEHKRNSYVVYNLLVKNFSLRKKFEIDPLENKYSNISN